MLETVVIRAIRVAVLARTVSGPLHGGNNLDVRAVLVLGRCVVAEATGRLDDGIDLCRRAAALAQRQGALSVELRAAMTLARMSAPRPHEALELLDSVYARFVEGFRTPDLLKAKRLIDELKILR